MKLSDLKPCNVCGGQIAPLFYRVTVEQLMIDAKAANQVIGLNTMFGGNALGLAETFAPNEVTMTLQTNTVTLCTDCAARVPLGAILFGVAEEAYPAP